MRPSFNSNIAFFPSTPEAATRLNYWAMKKRLRAQRGREKRDLTYFNQGVDFMTTPPPATPAAAEKKPIKKISIDIFDADAFFAAYPKYKRVDYEKAMLDEEKLRKDIRPLCKALHAAEAPIPGVNAFYTGEQTEEKTDTAGDAE